MPLGPLRNVSGSGCSASNASCSGPSRRSCMPAEPNQANSGCSASTASGRSCMPDEPNQATRLGSRCSASNVSCSGPSRRLRMPPSQIRRACPPLQSIRRALLLCSAPDDLTCNCNPFYIGKPPPCQPAQLAECTGQYGRALRGWETRMRRNVHQPEANVCCAGAPSTSLLRGHLPWSQHPMQESESTALHWKRGHGSCISAHAGCPRSR